MKKTTDTDNQQPETDLYEDNGFYLAEGLLKTADLLEVEALITDTVSQSYPCQNIHSPEVVDYLRANPKAVTRIYDALQNHQTLVELGKSKLITDLVKSFIPNPALYLKIVLRVDIPFEHKELAYWHQDDHYVKGHEGELTVWIPLQDTSVPQGCLSVMPGSHKLGRLQHSYTSGKKNVPQGIYDREVRLMEMTKGDALFFSSMLVHSSNFNFSENIRYSIQLRYTARDKAKSAFMKGTTNV